MNDKQGKLHKIIRSLTMFTIDNTTHEDEVRVLLTQAGSLLEQARAAMGDGIPASGQRTKAKARTRPIVEPSDAAKELAAQGKALVQDTGVPGKLPYDDDNYLHDSGSGLARGMTVPHQVE